MRASVFGVETETKGLLSEQLPGQQFLQVHVVEPPRVDPGPTAEPAHWGGNRNPRKGGRVHPV